MKKQQRYNADNALANRIGTADAGRVVSYEEQKEAGLVRARQSNFVAPEPTPSAHIVPLPPSEYSIQAQPSAHMESKRVTSAVDSAKGFSIRMKPLSIAFALTLVFLLHGYAGMPLVSVAAGVIVFGSFTMAWGVGWFIDALFSDAGVALFREIVHAVVLLREQAERWAHYNREG